MQNIIIKITNRLRNTHYTKQFKRCGRHCQFGGFRRLIGEQYITIGDSTKIGGDATLTAWDCAHGQSYTPEITIGDHCNIGEFCHISAINKVHLGNDILTGRWVTITDNSHGRATMDDIRIAPLLRELYSKGAVIIHDRVWIGDKATILAGVTIGEGAIIAANCTVTKDVPPHTVFAGNPGKVVKTIE